MTVNDKPLTSKANKIILTSDSKLCIKVLPKNIHMMKLKPRAQDS